MSSHSPPDHDERLPTLEGRALCFGLELAASHILDPAAADPTPEHARRRLFATIDPDLAARLAAGDVIVAEEITGAAETAHHALAAVAAAGVRALVARRFAPEVLIAAQTHGIVTLQVEAPSFLHTNDRVRLDLDAGKVVNLSSGDRTAICNFGDDERTRLRATLARRVLR